MRLPRRRRNACADAHDGVQRAYLMAEQIGFTLFRLVFDFLDSGAQGSIPPAIIPTTRLGSVPKVGGHSDASTTPSRPLVPAPM